MARPFSRRTLLSALPVAFIAPPASAASGHPAQHSGGLVDPAAEEVSPALMMAICAHCAAYAELRQIARRTDAVVLGRPVTRDELDRLDAASDLEERLLLALCEYPPTNDAERHDKAIYLLGIFEGDDREPELVTAILKSMTREASLKMSPSARPV
ncbi:hypothetical protein FJV76_14145 [Mesorhizobium sp. WSM4303]|uniref:hypothetical protein n=1 Tax=Mesorhizobium sp. WSM4303 TaxID=2589887 RepID=UPI00115D743C|nr:hypothetical protein [Mesorhizobium sp. WSM4303]TRD03777.1 hypothetical protein FJV76_14145 [Mesorhizobium sp. WSM4303]